MFVDVLDIVDVFPTVQVGKKGGIDVIVGVIVILIVIVPVMVAALGNGNAPVEVIDTVDQQDWRAGDFVSFNRPLGYGRCMCCVRAAPGLITTRVTFPLTSAATITGTPTPTTTTTPTSTY